MRYFFLSTVFFFTFHLCSALLPSEKVLNENAKYLSDTLDADSFIELEIKYYAPQSASVFLAWRTDNFPLEESLLWNAETKITNRFLYTPMSAVGDTFSILLSVPYNSVFEYYFWITKNKQGHYQDFWDLRASGKITVTDGTPIVSSAVYPTEKEKSEPLAYSIGWVVFFLVGIIFVFLYWAKWKYTPDSRPPLLVEKVFFIGLSLALFHAFARAEIINIYLLDIFNDFRIIPKIIKGSKADFYFVALLSLIFAVALTIIKDARVKKIIYSVFIFLALFSVFVAFINISAVINFGKPFNYQWLYYSDFLGNTETKVAFQENFSFKIAVNLILICASMLIFGHVLYIAWRLLANHKQLKRFTLIFLGLGLSFVFFMSFKVERKWTFGQSENAIKTMVKSIFSPKPNSYFFTVEIPDSIETFDPHLHEKMSSPFVIQTDHNVKNVMIIVLESAGAVYFDAYGGNFQLSPNLNRYENRSLVFKEMYAHAPATNRSLVSLIGSLYPYLSYKSITREAPDVYHPTISSVLNAEGYRTSFFSSADLEFQNCKNFLQYRGFDIVEDFSEIKCNEEFILESIDYTVGDGIDDMCLADRFALWLDEDTTQNFFSMIWTVQGHYPYFFAGEEEDFGVSNYYYNRYLNCMKHNDAFIGRVMSMLEDRQLDSSTLVVVVGDHGEAFGQHGQFGHATALYEENIKVPLYFINSTLFNGEQKKDIAEMKDLAPTILSLLNLEIPKKWQGRDLLNTYSDEGFYFAPWSDYLFGYRKGNMKYIFNETRKTFEIYDLSIDPQEKNDLSQSISEDQLAQVRYRIATWAQYQDKFINELLYKKQIVP